MGQIIPELVYRDILNEGFAWIKEDLTRFDHLMAGLREDDLVDLRGYFDPGVDKEISVVQGWPRSSSPFPCIAIALMGDTEQPFIGEELGLDIVEGEKDYMYGRMWSSNHMLIVCTDNPDLTVYLYHLIRAILINNAVALQELIMDLTFSGGDLAPEMRFLPDYIYTRALTIKGDYLVMVEQDVDIRPPRFSIQGRESTTAAFGEGQGDS